LWQKETAAGRKRDKFFTHEKRELER